MCTPLVDEKVNQCLELNPQGGDVMILFHLPQKPAGSLYLGLSWELKFSFSRSYCFFGVERTLLTLLWGKQSWKGCLMVLQQISEKIILNLRGDTSL